MAQSSSRGTNMHCLCATTRRAARLLTMRYDEALRQTGMNANQFEMMSTIRAAQPVDQTSLAKMLEADQTTVSRNLKLLLQMGWIGASIDKKDGRRRRYRVSVNGQRVLQEAARRWSSIQNEMEELLNVSGGTVLPALDRLMDAARGSCEAASSQGAPYLPV